MIDLRPIIVNQAVIRHNVDIIFLAPVDQSLHLSVFAKRLVFAADFRREIT